MRLYETSCCLSLILFGTASYAATAAKPVKLPDNYKSANNRLDCPAAHKSRWTGPNGAKWGILCGWDTQSTTYSWDPIPNINFEQCIQECAKKAECTIATYTGTCYLKKSGRNQGFVETNKRKHKMAVNLGRLNKNNGGDGPDDYPANNDPKPNNPKPNNPKPNNPRPNNPKPNNPKPNNPKPNNPKPNNPKPNNPRPNNPKNNNPKNNQPKE